MKSIRRSLCLLVLSTTLPGLLLGQQMPTTPSTVTVPQLVNFSGRVSDAQVGAVPKIAGVTFAIYSEQYEGSPLWLETQNVQPDSRGNFTAQLGAGTSGGVPLQLFSSGQARWLGVRVNGGEEQPRVLLLSVPYALKAADAQTLGGLPPSAFVLAPVASNAGSTSSSSLYPSASQSLAPPVGGSGTQNYIPIWTDSSGDLGNSILYQLGTGSSAKVGINEKNPLFTLDVNGQELVRGLFEMATTNYATPTKAYNSQPFNLESSAYNSSAAAYTLNHFQWQAEPTGNNTTSPGATLNLLYGTDPAAPAETGLQLSNTGVFTFAAGQTFPGTGTITGVTTAAGSGLTGGGTSGTLALSLTNSCSASQVLQWNGATWVCTTIAGGGTITGVTAGAGMTGGGTSGNVTLNVDSTKVAFLNVANKFTKAITVTTGVGSTPITAQNTAEAINATMTGDFPGVAAIEGLASATGTGSTYGVYGSSNSSSGIGVFGSTSGATGSGVFGQAAVGGAIGVTGENGSSGGGIGVSGFSSAAGIGVQGNAPGGIGVSGSSNGSGGFGVQAINTAAGGIGLFASGTFAAFLSGVVNVQGEVEATGVDDAVEAGGFFIGSGNDFSDGIPFTGVVGTGGDNHGGAAQAGTGGHFVGGDNFVHGLGGDGLISEPGGGASNGLAGLFMGDVTVEGNLSKGGGSFKIDHPLDPANKYLYHSFVESPDMMNIYNGNVTTDANGIAVVEFPDWFETLNRDFRYQLTVLGQFAQAIVSSKVVNHRFAIKTDKPNVEVSWQVTGIRQDAWANAHRIPVEQNKAEGERGFYLHPELYGAPREKNVAWARHPEMMQHRKPPQAPALSLTKSNAVRP